MPDRERKFLPVTANPLGATTNGMRKGGLNRIREGLRHPRFLSNGCQDPSARIDAADGQRSVDRLLLRPPQPQSGARHPWLSASERHRTQRFNEIVTPQIEDGLRLARHLTKSRADADDVLQEACLNAFAAIDSYQRGNARNWFLTVVRYAAYNWLRTNRRSRLVSVENLEVFEEENAQVHDCHMITPETELVARSDAQELSAMLATVPAPFRETLELRINQQHSYREISTILNVPLGTVMSRLARARQHLLTLVQND